MSAGMPLSEFTALLARQLAESATIADRRQRDDYVALAAEVGCSFESFVERATGRAAVERYLEEVVLPLVPEGLRGGALRFDETGLERLIAHFGDRIREAIENGSEIERYRLEQVIAEKLRGDAEVRYRDVRALLRTGLPRTQIRGGTLSAKVLLRDDGSGGIMAELPDSKSAKECGEAISTLTVELNVGAFPPFD
jgi:hypothetical protein